MGRAILWAWGTMGVSGKTPDLATIHLDWCDRSCKGEQGFEEMLKATSALRVEQEEEVRLFEKMREQRIALQQADGR